MFKIGDRIVHPMHGAGFIEGMEQQTVGGMQREYYNISLQMHFLSPVMLISYVQPL